MFGLDISTAGRLIIVICMLLFAFIAILSPIWLFLTQAYARECRDELRQIKEQIQGISKLT